MSTTIEISDYAHIVYKRWKRKTGLTSLVFFDNIINAVVMGKKREFYNSLEDPRKINHKPLSNVKIRKNYRKNNCN